MITSAKGRKFLRYISPIYDQSIILQAILEAVGTEWDEADRIADEVLEQLFPQSATWGIVYWEALLGISPKRNMPIEERRARVLARLRTRWSMTPSRMEQIVRSYSGDRNAYIRQFPAEYRFEASFSLVQSVDLRTLQEVIAEARPAHLDFSLAMGLHQGDSKVFVGSTLLTGEEITVYPWSISELTSSGKAYISTGYSTEVDVTTILPKGE